MDFSDQIRAELETRLSDTETQMAANQKKHELLVSEKTELWESNAKGYELEIERISSELEEVERGKRSIESELKSEQARFAVERNDLVDQVRVVNASVKSWTCKANESAAEVVKLKSNIDEKAKQHSDEMRDSVSIQNGLRAELKTVKALRDTLQDTLKKLQSEASRLETELKDETEKRSVLEAENQDFVKSTEWLEQRCKGLDEEIKRSKQSNSELTGAKASLETKLMDEAESVRKLRVLVEDTERNLKGVTLERKQAEEEVAGLRVRLERSLEDFETLTRDNGDLRAWVNDLEKQASELQNAARDFEEVEQSLQESLEAQRDGAEQVARLTVDLRKEREALRMAETKGRKAERDRETADEALSACEEKLRGVEERLAEIRELNVTKLSASEANVRSQAQRCAELETALAEAQRQVAELGHVSDEAFAVKSDLRRTSEEIVRLKRRCEDAEAKAESLDDQLVKCHDEMEQLRQRAGANGIKSLEAEPQ